MRKRERARLGVSGRRSSLRWVDAADHGPGPARRIDPAPLAALLAAWNGTDDAPLPVAEAERRVAEEAEDGAVHLVRLLAAMDVAARRTGGTLAHLADSPAVTAACRGVLHHLVELLQVSGLRAATAAARELDAAARLMVLTALRPYWQAPLRVLSEPLDDGHVVLPPRSWRS